MNVVPIERESAAAGCAKALRRAILSGELGAGERLPPERKLAEDFGVNRLTLRAALSQLLALGLVTVRQGSGYTVADIARVGGTDLLPDLLQMAEDDGALITLVEDLLAVRRALAGTVLARLARDAEPAAIDRIAAAVDRFENVCEHEHSSLDDFVEADFAIVAAMVQAIASPIIGMCINPVMLAVAQIKELAAAMYSSPRDNLAGHRNLIEWLRNSSLAPLQFVIAALAARDESTIKHMRKRSEKL